MRGRRRTYEACDYGLRYRNSDVDPPTFVPWARFDSYRETDDAIILERRWWFDVRLAAEEVPDDARNVLEDAIDT